MFVILKMLILVVFFCSTKGHAQGLPDLGVPGKQFYTLFFKKIESTRSNENVTESIDGAVVIPVIQFSDTSYTLLGKTQHLNFEKPGSAENFAPVEDLYNQQFGISWSKGSATDSTSVLANFGSAKKALFCILLTCLKLL